MSETRNSPPDGRAGIDAGLVRRLLRTQFPQWAELPVVPVAVDGWDNRTYRLGDRMTVRLPTHASYVPAVEKENTWLPRLAPSLPLPVPQVLGRGEPGEGYPHPWSVRGWIDGETAAAGHIADLPRFAESVAGFILALHRCDTTGGPLAGAHSFHRGASPSHYDEETRRCLAALGGYVDTAHATAIWNEALAAEWTGPPVWFHGDLAEGNLLVSGGELSAVIDFGTCGVGDPACDLVIAWGLFTGPSRTAFRRAVGQDEGTWARARGWLTWKALLVLAESVESARKTGRPTAAVSARAETSLRVLAEVMADHRRA
ncbi:aminoglycoside phosphotransferase (APT) family kinase protein [Kitasatospora sp. SolWspMP-SS2h]|uniref:aminoglycoside phosphotransferase family protein n=1 Tax=Kitasatospora sp. SolWspMP-SS2h TaxID=1305729 RepID=UPI000DBA51D1|nr:aminoglycoside phosphotransferase family protein [Kitasatospora sp. SolWspMP-SS2h]RAJ47121.1 aminoglycoside phosphotransferase (APT) family kinase protein [Kitasatospora sp. SolWspMP-SS2h]